MQRKGGKAKQKTVIRKDNETGTFEPKQNAKLISCKRTCWYRKNNVKERKEKIDITSM